MNKIVGIDLGTTFSAIAALNTIGKPEIIPNAEGERITPSAICFDEGGADVVRVGVEAINSRYINPSRCIRWIKRHMGESEFNFEIDGRKWNAVELSSLILKKLKQDASIEGPINDVVISVPAHFDEVRRKATMDAGKLAGLNVIGIVNEPVAAALYYATTRQVSGKVLVYDLGGGTFDVTIMEVAGQDIRILCSQGDHALGGVDFDRKIVEFLEEAYLSKTNSKLIDSEQVRAKYEDEAEELKKTLSRRPSAKTMLYGPAGSMPVEITRQNFDNAIAGLITRTQMLIEVALEEAGLKAGDIDKVLLVGGSTRIPLVQEKLRGIFGFEPETAVNVDEAVALGAAVHAGLTKLRNNPKSIPAGIAGGLRTIKLTDVCNHSYGTICARLDQKTNVRKAENYIILKKNTPLPCEVSRTFYTVSENQKQLEIIVTQGEDADPDFVNAIATHKLELPEGRQANRPIKVSYGYDMNQRMHCSFEDVDSGAALEIEVTLSKDGRAAEAQIMEGAAQVEEFQVK